MTWADPVSSRLALNLFRVAVILWLFLAWNRRSIRPASGIVLPMVCFFVVTAVATMASHDPQTSLQEMKVVELAFAVILVADVVRSLRVLRALIVGLLVTSTYAAVYGISLSGAGSLLRAQALYAHYINFGEMLLLVSLLALGLFVASWSCGRRGYKIILAIVAAILALALAATGTRTFLAALLVGCGVMIWIRFGWRTRALCGAVLLLALLAGGWWLQSRRSMGWFDAKDPGTQYRFLIWKDSARIIRQHPLLGVGFANVQRHPERFDMSAYRAFPHMISHFHSTPIEIAADCGIPALGIWLWLMVACWRDARHALDRSMEMAWFAHGTALGMLGAVAGLQVASLFHYVLGDPEPMLLFWVLMGVVVSIAHRPAGSQASF